MGGWFKRAGIYVYLWLIHVEVWQKTTKFCKTIIFQLNNLKREKRYNTVFFLRKCCFYNDKKYHLKTFHGSQLLINSLTLTFKAFVMLLQSLPSYLLFFLPYTPRYSRATNVTKCIWRFVFLMPLSTYGFSILQTDFTFRECLCVHACSVVSLSDPMDCIFHQVIL